MVLMVDTFCSPVNVIQGIQLILEHNILTTFARTYMKC